MKTWKKLAAGLAIALSVSLFAGAFSTPVTVNAARNETFEDAGYYEMTKLSYGDEELEMSMFEAFGIKCGLVLEEDGTGYLFFADEVEDLEWHDGELISDGDVVPYSLRRGILTISEEDSDGSEVYMEFRLSSDKAPTRAEVEDQSDAFADDWDDWGYFEGDDGDFYDDFALVEDVDQLMTAIGDNMTIVLKPGVYNITEWLEENEDDLEPFDWKAYEDGEFEDYGVFVDEVFDGVQAVIYNVDELTLVSADKEDPAEIVVDPRYADVLTFIDCDNLHIEDLVIGHSDGEGTCAGDVLAFDYSWDVEVTGCDLYGCGAYAITASTCNNLKVRDCDIHDCSYGIAVLSDASPAVFEHTSFHDCREYTMFELDDSDVKFISCTFENLDGGLITGDDWSRAIFILCELDDDAADSLEEAMDSDMTIRVVE